MYVCICNAITDKQIRQAADAGVRDLWQLQAELGVASNCGACKEQATAILRQNRQQVTWIEPEIYRPSAA
ncbi:MAG: (2Fe-2S)-binding protein [Proteobacteria bacterium]|nr:(2Fe-2S)-binding protein [Pseudomonadota bacterium]